MVLLILEFLVVLALWWAWKQRVGGRGGAVAGVAVPPLFPQCAHSAPTRPPPQPVAERRRLVDPPLTEDDVITFGLALEATADVVTCALADGQRPPALPPLQRDAHGTP